MRHEIKLLRPWIKTVLGPDVTFTEPAAGGTMGKPDCLFDVKAGSFEVELKWAEIKKSRLIFSLRPAQIRYHAQAARRGKKTAIMLGYWEEGLMRVDMVQGAHCINFDKFVWLVKRGNEPNNVAKQRIEVLLASKEFWQ